MDAVRLHHAGDAVDVFEHEGEQGVAVGLGDGLVHGFEFADVIGAIVAGQGDAEEDDFGAGAGEAGGDLLEVIAGAGDGDAAEAVIATEFEQDDFRGRAEGIAEAVEAALGGIAADAGVDDVVGIAALVEDFLQDVGVGLTDFEAKAGGDAIAEAEDDGAFVLGRGSGSGDGRGDIGFLGLWGCILAAAGEENRDEQGREKRKQPHDCQNRK